MKYKYIFYLFSVYLYLHRLASESLTALKCFQIFCVLFYRWVLDSSGSSLAPRHQLQRLIPSARPPSVSGTSARSRPAQRPAGLEPGAGAVQRAPGRDPWWGGALQRPLPADRPAQTLQHHRWRTTALLSEDEFRYNYAFFNHVMFWNKYSSDTLPLGRS